MSGTDEASQFQFQFSQTGDSASRPSKDFKRAYMACEPCRKTKAKCMLPDGNRPCLKCQRERRDCIFSTKRSTRGNESRNASAQHSPARSKRARRDSTTPQAQAVGRGDQSDPQTASHSVQNHQGSPFASSSGLSSQVERATRSFRNSIHHEEQDIDAEVMRTVVSSSNDALGLLFRAAEQQEEADGAAETQNFEQNSHIINTPESSGWSTTVPVFTFRAARLSSAALATMQIWERFAFCKMGWFGPLEAITYIDLFFRNMFPLTPVLTNFYSHHENHGRLVSSEPLLCCTLLMISSRYHILPGQGGISRAHFIHNRLWNQCEQLVHRLTFGQEYYSTAKTRTLGSIEALLLMTEWHPRALHFSPESNGWDANLAPTIHDTPNGSRRDENSNLKRWREEVFEPAKRSDRMSWMILGLATSLAHELRLFDMIEAGQTLPQDPPVHAKLRIRKLLYVYVNQLASRLGCASILPQNTAESYPDSPANNKDVDEHQQELETLISLWIGITKLHKTAAEMFFPDKTFTTQLLKSGRYVGLLEHFQPLLTQWRSRFEAFKSKKLSSGSRQMVYVDYQYVRMYINSLAIQAVVERTRAHQGSDLSLNVDILRLENRQDYNFTQEVIEAGCTILQTAVDLANDGILTFAPVRLVIRITSATILLLKALSLGTRNAELQNSLSLLESCIHALRSNFDDVHLSSRYATLIARHVQRFRNNFRVHSRLGDSGTATPNIQQGANRQPPASNSDIRATSENNENRSNSNQRQNPPGTNSSTTGAGRLEFDDWLSQPFNPSIAPFGLGNQHSGSGFEINSLDFLWNLDGLTPG